MADSFINNAGQILGSQIQVGGGFNNAVILGATSTTQGFLPPRMTTGERDAIVSPPEGLLIYNTTTQQLNQYNGTVWEDSAKDSLADVLTVGNTTGGTDLIISGSDTLDVQGEFLPDRKTAAQITAIASPVDGQQVYNTDDQHHYYYDGSRSKWLSVETVTWQWSRNGAGDNTNMFYNNLTDATSGPLMGKDLTITAVTVNAGAGQADKQIFIRDDGVDVFTFNLNALQYNNQAVDVDMASGSLMTVFISALDASISNTAMAITTRWRV